MTSQHDVIASWVGRVGGHHPFSHSTHFYEHFDILYNIASQNFPRKIIFQHIRPDYLPKSVLFFCYVPLLLPQGFIYFVVVRRSKKYVSVTSVYMTIFERISVEFLLLLLPLEYVFVNIGPKIAGRLCQWILSILVSNSSFCDVVKSSSYDRRLTRVGWYEYII